MHGRLAPSRKHTASCVRAALSLCYAAPFPPCFIRSLVSLCSKTTLRLIPVTRVDLTLVASGSVLNDIQLTPVDVSHVNYWTPVVRSKA